VLTSPVNGSFSMQSTMPSPLFLARNVLQVRGVRVQSSTRELFEVRE